MSSKSLRFIIIILCQISLQAFLISVPVHAQVGADAINLTFKDLGYDDVRLKGLYGTNSMWIPFQSDWPVGNVEIELVYNASPLLNSQGSILTILANNQEITSIRPVGDGQDHILSFVVPLDYQLSNGINLSFDGYLRLTDEFCEDSFNTGQWLIVRNNSRVKINLNELPPAPQLTDLPQAMMVQGKIDLPPVVFVLPDRADDLTLTVAAQVATKLGADIETDNLPIEVATPTSLTEQQKATSNLVVIGLPTNQPLIHELRPLMPIPPLKDGFVSQDGILIPPTDGVVQIFNSPWHSLRHILLVSGNADAGLSMAGKAFVHESTFQSLTGSFHFIRALVDRPESAQAFPWRTSQTSFAQLGEFDRQVTGLGITDSYYFFRYPSGLMLNDGAQMILHVAFSPALRDNNSYAVVYINDIYIGAINVDATDEDSWVALDVPVQSLNQLSHRGHSGELNIRFSIANLISTSNCEQVSKDSSWTKIYADSYFQFNFTPVELPDLYFFPYPIVSLNNDDPVKLVLPDDATISEMETALSVSALLGKSIFSNLDIDLTRVASETPETLAGHQVILISTPTRNPLIGEILTGQKTRMPVDVYQVLGSSPVGVFYALASPWDAKMNVLAIYGNTEEGFNAAAAAIYEHGKLTNESGSIAIIHANEEPVVIYREAGLPQPQIVHPDVILSESTQQANGSDELATPVVSGTASNLGSDNDAGATSDLTGTERLILIITVFFVILVAVGALVRIAWRSRA